MYRFECLMMYGIKCSLDARVLIFCSLSCVYLRFTWGILLRIMLTSIVKDGGAAESAGRSLVVGREKTPMSP